MSEWRRISKYAETDGTYTVSACKVKGEWKFTLWRGNGTPRDTRIATYNSASEARASAYDYV